VNRSLRMGVWVLFAATMYLILQEAVAPWVRLPGLGNVGFTLLFVLFAVGHSVVLEGGRFTGLFFACCAVVSYAMEETGVRTGLVYGKYHYSDMLGAKLGHVPVIIPLAWFMMIYPSWRVAKALLSGVDTRSLAGITVQAAMGAMVMTAWDAGGAYFGVPRRNYLGWLATTFIVYWIAGWLARDEKPRPRAGFDALPIFVYAFFALRYMVTSEIAALQVVAVFAMGTPAVLALARVFLPRASMESSA
jgi:uncharacterized membrane protein